MSIGMQVEMVPGSQSLALVKDEERLHLVDLYTQEAEVIMNYSSKPSSRAFGAIRKGKSECEERRIVLFISEYMRDEIGIKIEKIGYDDKSKIR
mmetsp:Transcript_38295/g.36654  ORF Transcript_38295/g.36654 Transcript_38295/m.36654 type:complete len:94 (+) Transcript_38295:307-588(+)